MTEEEKGKQNTSRSFGGLWKWNEPNNNIWTKEGEEGRTDIFVFCLYMSNRYILNVYCAFQEQQNQIYILEIAQSNLRSE